ncbi:Uncharacterised protein [Mycobacterium tuberculosis]|nr:Uncharacterised protein [Mycobacterium tuberculosis]
MLPGARPVHPDTGYIPPRATSCPAITLRWISLVPSPPFHVVLGRVAVAAVDTHGV